MVHAIVAAAAAVLIDGPRDSSEGASNTCLSIDFISSKDILLLLFTAFFFNVWNTFSYCAAGPFYRNQYEFNLSNK